LEVLGCWPEEHEYCGCDNRQNRERIEERHDLDGRRQPFSPCLPSLDAGRPFDERNVSCLTVN
jgi:hypothetical protein